MPLKNLKQEACSKSHIMLKNTTNASGTSAMSERLFITSHLLTRCIRQLGCCTKARQLEKASSVNSVMSVGWKNYNITRTDPHEKSQLISVMYKAITTKSQMAQPNYPYRYDHLKLFWSAYYIGTCYRAKCHYLHSTPFNLNYNAPHQLKSKCSNMIKIWMKYMNVYERHNKIY